MTSKSIWKPCNAWLWNNQESKNLWTTHQRSQPWPWFNIKMLSYQYRKSHCGDKTILRPSYIHHGTSYTGKTFLYWIGAQGPHLLTYLLSLGHGLVITATGVFIWVRLLMHWLRFNSSQLKLGHVWVITSTYHIPHETMYVIIYPCPNLRHDESNMPVNWTNVIIVVFYFCWVETSLMNRQPTLFPNICVIRWLVTALFFPFLW